MYSEIFYLLFVVIFLAFFLAILFKNSILFLISVVLIGSFSILIAGTGIDYATGRYGITYNTTGDMNELIPIYEKVTIQNDKGLWGIQFFMQAISIPLFIVALWWAIKYTKKTGL
jgi:glucan phosphoethanolaminetransferase (alkaline phosphatase superfamily)